MIVISKCKSFELSSQSFEDVCICFRQMVEDRGSWHVGRTGAVNKDAEHWLVRIDRFTNVDRLLEWEFDWLRPFPPAGSVEAAVIERFILRRVG
ncbi:Eukaryotic translation initiation factor 3 subunit [Trichinella pseudospiralis]